MGETSFPGSTKEKAAYIRRIGLGYLEFRR
jgi:hypothetical protein